jgi:hypothetical protein
MSNRFGLASLMVLTLALGCAAEIDAPGSTRAGLRDPQICPAIAILCVEGYSPRALPNCRWTCAPDRGTECRTDDECTIYCITTPCPAGVCERGRCTTEDEDVSACATVLCAVGTECVERGNNARCVPVDTCGDGMSWDAAAGACVCTSIGLCVEGYTWDPVACQCLSPCATVRCAAGTQCVAHPDGSASCEPDAGACIRTGCSGQICADGEMITTCEWRPEYDCYRAASCERQADGACGWTDTPELAACLDSSI